MARAKAAGFYVQLFFVGIDDPQTNIERVRLRVAQGGHDVPTDRIVSRWHRTMALLHRAIKTADQAFLFDNSAAGNHGLKLILIATRTADGNVDVNLKVNSPPSWLRRYVLEPLHGG